MIRRIVRVVMGAPNDAGSRNKVANHKQRPMSDHTSKVYAFGYERTFISTNTGENFKPALLQFDNPEETVVTIKPHPTRSSWALIGTHDFSVPDPLLTLKLYVWEGRVERGVLVLKLLADDVFYANWLQPNLEQDHKDTIYVTRFRTHLSP